MKTYFLNRFRDTTNCFCGATDGLRGIVNCFRGATDELRGIADCFRGAIDVYLPKKT